MTVHHSLPLAVHMSSCDPIPKATFAYVIPVPKFSPFTAL